VARAHDPDHFDLAAWERDSGLTRELTLQLTLADRSGDIAVSNLSADANHTSIADREHFRVPRDLPGDPLFISRALIGRISGRWSVQFVRKLFDAGGGFDGVIVASLDPSFLTRFYGSLDIGRGALLLTSPDGIVRAAAPAGVADLASDLTPTQLMQGAKVTALGTVRITGPQDGIDRIYSWRRVDPHGLIVAVGLSTADALAGYRRDLEGCITIGVVLTLLTLVVHGVLTRNRRDAIRSQAILRAAVDNISQGLLVVDTERRVPVLNARAAELLQLPPALARPGVAFDTLLNWQVETGEFDGPEGASARTLVRAGGIELGSSVYRRTRHNGTVLEFRTKSLDTGLAVRTITDVTEEEQYARVLADARDAAEAAAQARSDFLAVMSHEIRTPLNGVIGVAELLEGSGLQPEQRDYVRLIKDSGSHLLALINDILDFSRLEASRVQLEAVDFDPAMLMQDVAGLFYAQASAKGLVLSVESADTVAAAVTGDPGRLRQVLLNLISNAIKFTNQGRVDLRLAQVSAEGGRARLLFSVVDTGIGIAPEAISRIFEDFTQVDGSISRRFGGSGLGLAICRRLVTLMGGSIAVDSEPGIGSDFRFDILLPLAAAVPVRATVAPQQTDPASPVGLHVLVAEDNATNRLVVLRLLERLGHCADAVGNGAEAITALGKAQYDLVLMDVMMPEMDGLTATRRIREAERPTAHMTIIGLTAGSHPDNLADCLAAGMDAAATKPITLVSLGAAIAEGLERVATPPAAAPTENPVDALSDLREAFGDEALADILATFAEDTSLDLAALSQAAASGNSAAIHRLVHSVSGAAGNVGATALAARAGRLERDFGSLSASSIGTEVRAMQADLDAVLAKWGLAPAAARAST
jgi:signal transduction histidine kinase/CheY-like chemotaxis protein